MENETLKPRELSAGNIHCFRRFTATKTSPKLMLQFLEASSAVPTSYVLEQVGIYGLPVVYGLTFEPRVVSQNRKYGNKVVWEMIP